MKNKGYTPLYKGIVLLSFLSLLINIHVKQNSSVEVSRSNGRGKHWESLLEIDNALS